MNFSLLGIVRHRTTAVVASIALSAMAVIAVEAAPERKPSGAADRKGSADRKGPFSPNKDEPLSPEATQAAEKLKAELPTNSEARLMLDTILEGRMMGPTDGWFKTALSQSRYRWADVVKKYDTNKNGKIEPSEFRGTKADFARLDQNGDGNITESDMDWKLDSLANTAANRFYGEADRDGDGKLSRDEFVAMFDQWDEAKDGFLSLDDLNRHMTTSGWQRKRSFPTKNQLVLGLARQEVGSLQPGPALNEQAPEFQLKQLGTDKTYRLAELVGKKPVVLVFGNVTCGPFRNQGGNLEKLYRRYKDRAEFVMVYVREAHPTDGWVMESNELVHVSFAQPKTFEQKTAAASKCQSMLKLGMPVLVDTMEDTVGARYSGMPSRLYVLDKSGKVAYKSGRGPFGFKPGECEQALIFQLQE